MILIFHILFFSVSFQGLTNVGLGARSIYNQDEAATVYGQLFTPDEGQEEKTAIIPGSEQ